ncbi:hypothetical protein [Kordiimonas marina]|uniref:hypothetical protein n=1 Tax=Kordiimonas marina TaxID=2872312 RepID=UPI001FF27247|nr:hypothetical protein [Kordiimonas marina]MCJ9429671.1 hypothetical protein [Kordiimonas marina]
MVLWDMIVLVVLIGVIGGTINNWIKMREKQSRAAAAGHDEATNSRIQKLEERVRVLERIVTDKGSRLKDEIDAL